MGNVDWVLRAGGKKLVIFFNTEPMITSVILGIAIAATASSQPKPGRWWDGDPSKEIPAIKAALQKAEGVQTPTGYEDKKVLMPLIKAALKENQSGGLMK